MSKSSESYRAVELAFSEAPEAFEVPDDSENPEIYLERFSDEREIAFLWSALERRNAYDQLMPAELVYFDRFYLDLSLKDIARKRQMSVQQVSRSITKVLEELRKVSYLDARKHGAKRHELVARPAEFFYS